MIYNVNFETRTGDCENSYANFRIEARNRVELLTKIAKASEYIAGGFVSMNITCNPSYAENTKPYAERSDVAED